MAKVRKTFIVPQCIAWCHGHLWDICPRNSLRDENRSEKIDFSIHWINFTVRKEVFPVNTDQIESQHSGNLISTNSSIGQGMIDHISISKKLASVSRISGWFLTSVKPSSSISSKDPQRSADCIWSLCGLNSHFDKQSFSWKLYW